MEPEQFHERTRHQLIRAGQGQAAYWAFVPAPLPPEVDFSSTLIQALSKADRAIGELAGLSRMLPNPHLFVRPFMRREAVLSSRIEGTQADLADLYAYEAGQLYLPGFNLIAPETDVKEVLNYVRALEYGLERIKSLPLSKRLIRELHEQLMKGVRGEYATPGEFRRTQNWIGPPGCTLNEASYVLPPVEAMHLALDAFEQYLHQENTYPPLVRLAFIHYQFEAIHPFIDGNGRIGRLLISLLLAHWELLPIPLLYLSAFFERHRRVYYDLLLGVSQRGAWEEWLSFFLAGVAEQSQDAIGRAKRLQDLQVEWRKQLHQARVSGLLSGIAEYLFEVPIISAREVTTQFTVSHPTAKKALRRLAEMGLVEEVDDKGRKVVYFAKPILKILS
jgi:Fic family protein